MLRQHFRDLHPKDFVETPREGIFPQCERCAMQCNPHYPHHIYSQVCQVGVEHCMQRDSTITLALALQQLIYVEGEVLEKVESFQYLGRILAQDDKDIQAVRNQIKKQEAYGPGLAKYYRRITLSPRSAPSSTRWLCSRSSSMAARHGISHQQPWHIWKGFTSVLHTVWQKYPSHGGDQIKCGSTPDQTACAQGVQDVHHLTLYWCQEGDNFLIRSRSTNLQIM